MNLNLIPAMLDNNVNIKIVINENEFKTSWFNLYLGYNKVLVGVGLAETGFTNDFEIIDLKSPGEKFTDHWPKLKKSFCTTQNCQ